MPMKLRLVGIDASHAVLPEPIGEVKHGRPFLACRCRMRYSSKGDGFWAYVGVIARYIGYAVQIIRNVYASYSYC